MNILRASWKYILAENPYFQIISMIYVHSVTLSFSLSKPNRNGFLSWAIFMVTSARRSLLCMNNIIFGVFFNLFLDWRSLNYSTQRCGISNDLIKLMADGCVGRTTVLGTRFWW